MSRKLGGGSKCKNFDAGGKWTHAAGRCKEEVLDGTWRWSLGLEDLPKSSRSFKEPQKRQKRTENEHYSPRKGRHTQ